MPAQKRLWSRIPAALLCLGLSLPVQADEILDQGRRRLESGDPAGAYALLEPLETQRAGEPAYDFLLGLAALESGRNTRAVFALERVLALEPGNARARAEIARAYLALGEHRAAREEFERVKQQDIPPGVTATIDRLLALILRAENLNKPTLKGFLELGLGSDSNVNSATDANTVAVPALGIARLNPDSVQTSDLFAALNGGLAYRHPLPGGHFLTANLNAAARRNQHDSQFDTSSFDAALGWQQRRDQDTVSLAFTGSNFQRDGRGLRDTVGLNAQWQRDYDQLSQGTLFLQYLDLKYPGQEIRNVDRVVLGAGYALAVLPPTVVFGSLYAGSEMTRAGQAKHLGHHLLGIRVGAQHRINPAWTLAGSAGYEGRRYGAAEPLFDQRRTDDQTDFSLGLQWSASPRWKLGARGSYLQNHSNLEIYKYSRSILSFNSRFEF